MSVERIETTLPSHITEAFAKLEMECNRSGFRLLSTFLLKKYPTGLQVTIAHNPRIDQEARQRMLALVKGTCEKELSR